MSQIKKFLLSGLFVVLLALPTTGVFSQDSAQPPLEPVPETTITETENAEPVTTRKNIFPERSGFVIDQAEVFNNTTRTNLETSLAQLAEDYNVEFVIATVKSLDKYEIEDYTYQLGNFWRIGQQSYSKGLLFLIAPNEEKVRIEAGFGIERAINNFTLLGIYRDQILPELRTKNYNAAATKGVNAISSAISNESLASLFAGNKVAIPQTNLMVIIGLLITLTIIVSLLTKKHGWHGGGIIGVIAGIILSIFNFNLNWAILVFFLLGFSIDLLTGQKQKSTPTPISPE